MTAKDEELPPALRAGFAERLPARAFVTRYGRASLAPGGPALDGDRLARPPAEYVVATDGAAPRVVAEAPGVRLMLYVDATDLRTTVVRAAPLVPSPGSASPADAGVALFPGTPITTGARDRDWVDATVRDTAFEAQGWMPAGALGVVYVPQRPRAAEATLTLRAGAALLDAPGGHALGVVRATLAASRSDARGGFTAVEIDRPPPGADAGPYLRACGWVADAEVTPRPFEEEVSHEGEGVVVSMSPHALRLRAGIALRASIGGDVVGVTLDGAEAHALATQGGWTQLALATPWGDATVWAVAADAQRWGPVVTRGAR